MDILKESLGKIGVGLITAKVITKIVDEGTEGVKDAGIKFAGNYMKRRNVGFGVCHSFCGSWEETTGYYGSIIAGDDPVIYKQAVVFEK